MTTCTTSLSLERLLWEIRQRRLVLLFGKGGKVVLWSPNVRVPREIRAAINTYNRELARMLLRAEIYVCPSPELHRHSWDWRVKRFCCDVCARLLVEVS